MRIQRLYCEACIFILKLPSPSSGDLSDTDSVTPDYTIPVLLCQWAPGEYESPCIRWSCTQTPRWSTRHSKGI